MPADPTVHITNGVPDSGTGNITTLGQVLDPTNGPAAIKAASTAPVSGDKALVVAIHPLSVNGNLNVDGNGSTTGGIHAGAPVAMLDPYGNYKTVAASQTGAVLGATGAQYDYLAGLLIIPATTAAGAVSIADGNGSAISVFAGGGTTPLTDLKPFMIPVGAFALAVTTPGWKVTTGTNVSVVAIGKFT